jgi:hypothetical protein
MICRTLEDIDRFFETGPAILVHRNALAVQLQRPFEFIEADERIAKTQAGREKERGTTTEIVETTDSPRPSRIGIAL